jgi:hypothetical protein
MTKRTTTTTDLDDDLDIKTMFDGWPEVRMPEPEAPPPSLESARRALERGGYVVVDSTEFRGRRNFICEFVLARGTAPLILEDDLLTHHIGEVFVQAGFEIPAQNLVVGCDDDGDQVRLGFLAWCPRQ